MAEKIRVLFVAANPADMTRNNLEEEIRLITEKIRASEYRDALDVRSVWAVRPDDLQHHLLEFKPHVVHFSGHGNPTNELNFLDKDGDSRPVPVSVIADLFEVLKDDVRLVVLNACFSKVQAKEIVKFIDCAIGSRSTIGDDAAIAFAASFYRGIGFGKSIQDAFKLGLTSVGFVQGAQGNKPEILCRKGVDAASVFLIREKKNKEKTVMVDRKKLLKVLGELTDERLMELKANLGVQEKYLPSEKVSSIEKAIALLRLAEAPGGCGLDKIVSELEEMEIFI